MTWLKKRKKTEKPIQLLKLYDSISEISIYRFNKVVSGKLEYLSNDNTFIEDRAEQYLKSFDKLQKEYLDYIEVDSEQDAITLAWQQWIVASCDYAEAQIEDDIERMTGDIVLEDFGKKQKLLDADSKLVEVGALKEVDSTQGVRFARVVAAVESFKGFRLDLKEVTVEYWITYLNEYRNHIKKQNEENEKRKKK